MRPGFLAAIAVVLLVASVAFLGGQYWAKHQAERQTEIAVSWQSASQRAEALFIARRTLENLNAGKVGDANVVLVRYAKLQAAGLEDCSKSPKCSAWVGTFMPTKAELSEIALLKERP